MKPDAAPGVAVFDLDGTLTRSDTLLPFLARALRRHSTRLLRLPVLLAPVAAYVLSRDRGALKGAVIHRLLAGLDRPALDALAAAFADEVCRSRLHDEARGAIEAHRAAGDTLVLMSASPDLYVPRIAALLGFAECLCTAVQWNGDRLDGRLAGANCRGAEKSHRLQALKARYPGARITAYGNSASDLDHMRQCDAAVYVNPGASEATWLTAAGVKVVHWH